MYILSNISGYYSKICLNLYYESFSQPINPLATDLTELCSMKMWDCYFPLITIWCFCFMTGTQSFQQGFYQYSKYAIVNENFYMYCITKSSSIVLTKAENHIYLATYHQNGSLTIQHNFTDVTISCEPKEEYYNFTVKLHTVQLNQNQQKWKCFANGIVGEIELMVAVPVTHVTLQPSSQLILKEDTVTNVSCRTSFSRPNATITWYVGASKDAPLTVYFNDAEKICSNNNDNSLVSTNCTVPLLLNRTYNGWTLLCTAKNINNYTTVSANASIPLNVTYPTNQPNITCSNNDISNMIPHNGIYKAVLNTEGKLFCSVDGGNPTGSLSWNCTDLQEPSILYWNVTQGRTCTCTSTNSAGTTSTSVQTEVLYPPIIGKMKNISAFEGDPVTLNCNVTGGSPTVNLMQWTSSKYNVSDKTLTIQNISHNDDTVYTCTAFNTMRPSCRGVVTGNTSKSIHVDVLYPPSIYIPLGKNVTVKEGDMLNYTCAVIAGNPTNTNVKWTRTYDTRTWNSSQLLIYNVTRYDDSVYTCYVSNLMVNSEGVTQIGNVSADIRLVIQFKASVTEFYIEGYEHTSNVTVNENVSLTFVCHPDGNPTPEARIYQTDKLVDSLNASMLSHNTTAYCTGGPVNYRCEGSNSLNTIPSTRQIELSVYCKPRRNMNVDSLVAASAINQTVTLSYTVLAYPHPTFNWSRNGTTIDTNDKRVFVTSKKLSTNLTINITQEEDFGMYTLLVTNDVGNITETYVLKPQGVPETPTNLTQNNDTTTDSMISLIWTPGFNNGLEQTFTIMYKQLYGDLWRNVNVTDTGSIVGYNITGLQSETVYGIVLFSYNSMGRSRSNVTLTCKTKQRPVQEEVSASSPIVPAVAGSVSAIVILGGVCVVLFVLRRRRMKDKPPPSETEPSSSYYANVDNSKNGKLTQQKSQQPLNNENGADKIIYENAGLTKKTGQVQEISLNDTASVQPGVYVNCSIKKREEVPMARIIPPAKASSANPPPIPVKTTLKNGLLEVDERDEHISSAEDVYVNQGKVERIKSVFVNELFDFVAGKTLQSLAPEFLTLPKNLILPHNDALKPENIKLNRYNGIFPYDHSRVKIPSDPTFFTNANYMDGYQKEKRYIASLGPTKDTSNNFETFWKMIWHEKSDIIVMVTNLRELTGMKCQRYWPNFETTAVYGEVTVMCFAGEEYAEYTVRTFNVSCGNETRTLTQLHFTAWPDKGVPDDLTSLLEFLQRIKFTASSSLGPIIVHCSAGIGRTGTLIALDRIIDEGKATNAVNLSRCVHSMRQQRTSMVQTLEQYVYVYKASVYALTFECKPITAEELPNKIRSMTETQYKEQFNMLKIMVDNESDQEKKAIRDNANERSNRQSAEIAGDKHRVRLYIDKDSEESDYINAIYVNSFKTKSKFIVAQTPLREFVEDFISMIFQEQCICVIALDGNTPSSLDIGAYLPPKNQRINFETFTVSCDTLDSNSKYTVHKMEIKNTGQHYSGKWITYHFKYHDWKHGKDTPGDVRSFVEFYKEVEEFATQFGEKESHILVHCLDASTRSGLYCYMSCLLEKIHCERRVNVGNTLRQVRNRRKTTIKSAKQLKFCYKTLEAFVEMELTN